MKEDSPFCRFCQDPLPQSISPIQCLSCKNTSVPITERAISITPKQTREKIDLNQDVLFLDVRWSHERETATIEGTLFIPLNQLESRLSELPKEKEIIIHCKSGGRSRFATLILLCNGFTNVKNMVGGINEWSREVDPKVPLY